MKIARLNQSHFGRLAIVDGVDGDKFDLMLMDKNIGIDALMARQLPHITARIPESLDMLAAPLIPGARILCVGLNYRNHAAEAGLPIPDRPALFSRFAASFVGPADNIVLPAASHKFDFEGELAVVIGTAGRHIPETEAHRHILGFTCFADNSLRDWQLHSKQVLPGKNFDKSGAIGPWIETDPAAAADGSLTIETFVNGQLRQRGSTGDMIFSPAALIAYVSSFMRLEPGDVIATGTPAGVAAAQAEPNWLRVGDTVEIAISGVGRLRNQVIAEAAG